MTKWYRVVAVSAVALMFTTGSALAAGEGAKGKAASPAGKGASPAAEKDTDAPSAAPRMGAGGMQGEHTMTGEVTKIDKTKGLVSVKTPETTLDLHFPPAALEDVKKGDRVTVELSLKEAAAGAASPAMDKDAKGAGSPAMGKSPATKSPAGAEKK